MEGVGVSQVKKKILPEVIFVRSFFFASQMSLVTKTKKDEDDTLKKKFEST